MALNATFTPQAASTTYYDPNLAPGPRLINVLRNFYNLRRDVCTSLPNTLKANDDETCSRCLNILGVRIGSLIVDMRVDTNLIGNGDQA